VYKASRQSRQNKRPANSKPPCPPQRITKFIKEQPGLLENGYIENDGRWDASRIKRNRNGELKVKNKVRFQRNEGLHRKRKRQSAMSRSD
jgi:hypothetical protein